MLETLTVEKISVGAPFFNSTFVPIMTPLIIAMAFGPMMPWKRADLFAVLGKLKIAIAAVILVLIVTYWLAGGPAFALFWHGLAIWLFVGTMLEWADGSSFSANRSRPASAGCAICHARHTSTMLAHAGWRLSLPGSPDHRHGQKNRFNRFAIGESTVVSGHTFTLSSLREYQGPNFFAREATITIATPANAP